MASRDVKADTSMSWLEVPPVTIWPVVSTATELATPAVPTDNPSPVLELVQRAGLPSETRRFARNYAQEGVYVLHGDADDNVPVRLARLMRDDGRIAHRQVRKIRRAELAGKQADAVDHDARRAAAVHHILKGRLAALPPPFEEPRQPITRQARHLNADVHHEQVVRRRHERHADDTSQQ